MNVIPQRVKDGFVGLIGPLARALIRAGVHPNTITTVGTLVVVGSGVAFAAGAVRLGGLLLLISGICDLLDGQVARQGGKITTFGAFYDSTLDRIGEGAVFAGLIFYFLTGPLPADLKPRAIAAGLVALIASFLVSYTRARAEALGVENKVGIAPRAERILLLGVPALFLGAGPGRPGVVLFWIVAVLALVSAITVIQRVVHVARVARGAPPPSPIPKRETLPGMAAARRKGH
ncbi:MAG TPA: CDP-alcohol phosphatidyltransferase family protein [Gemmatimonadales bacterium]|jgi:CDP-diacylglycerol--glycerol-3-phosphate 3-phosphatidyltransferase|nr:CDP-alcohol phosphatidyltransferase family protein [Gemmatimonadales bacterium]